MRLMNDPGAPRNAPDRNDQCKDNIETANRSCAFVPLHKKQEDMMKKKVHPVDAYFYS